MQLFQAVTNVLTQLANTLDRLSDQEYCQPCRTLSNNTIGQHVRHIIELFQCLEQGYERGLVNYEQRKRDKTIEVRRELAMALLQQIERSLSRPDKVLVLEAQYDALADRPARIDTNYLREVAYNLEHTIHHMALIRIGIEEVASLPLTDDFGVASATVQYRRQCAQ